MFTVYKTRIVHKVFVNVIRQPFIFTKQTESFNSEICLTMGSVENLLFISFRKNKRITNQIFDLPHWYMDHKIK